MLEVSQKFREEVYNQTTGRRTSAKVRFEIVDDTAYKDVTTVISSPSTLSPLYKSQITDRVREFEERFATFEKDFFKLDGSFKVPPSETEIIENNIQMGYWSEELSSDTPKKWKDLEGQKWKDLEGQKWIQQNITKGTFLEPIILRFLFSQKHKSAGFSIYFDTLNGEYAMDFDVIIYEDDRIVEKITVEDNTQVKYSYMNKLNNYNEIVVVVKSWSKSIRRCKISEFDFGITKEYTDEDLISVRIIQELSPTTKSIPSDELNFKIDNSSKKFNPLNPEGFYEFLNKGQQIYVDIGVEIEPEKFEYVNSGKYYLTQWISNEGTLTSTFIARDIFEILNDREVNPVEQPIDTTLYEMAKKVMVDNEIEEYEITNNLKAFRTDGVHKAMSYRKLLEYIVTAGKCVIFQDNTGKVIIKEMTTVTDTEFKLEISEQPSLGSTSQLINNVLVPQYNFSSFEKDRFKLDGTFQLPSENMENVEVGWWSNQISTEGKDIWETWGDVLNRTWFIANSEEWG